MENKQAQFLGECHDSFNIGIGSHAVTFPPDNKNPILDAQTVPQSE
jgi:hypothetical protein